MGLQDTGAGGIIYIIVGRAGKTGQKQTSSWLVRLFLSSFPHRADARCFLSPTLFGGKKMTWLNGYD